MTRRLALIAALVTALALAPQAIAAPAYAGPPESQVAQAQDSGPVAPDPGVQTHGVIEGCGIEWSWTGGSPYCDLGRQGQVYASNGAITTLTAAICAASGGLVCSVAAGLAAVAVSYISDHGICSGNLRVQGTRTRCL